jgi:hypothetical protein
MSGDQPEFLHRFEHALAEEDGPLIVVGVEVVVVVEKYGLAVEVVFVVDKVHLEFGAGYGSHLNDQGFFFVAHRNVDTG